MLWVYIYGVEQNDSFLISSSDVSVDTLDDVLVRHSHRETFTDSLTFFVLYFAFVAFFGSIFGFVLALRT